MWTRKSVLVVSTILLWLQACGGSSGDAADNDPPDDPDPPAAAIDVELRALIQQHNLTGDPSSGRDLPTIDEPLAQLGMKLFFSKGLGGEMDSACVSCHHPVLGGADGLSLPFGVGAVDPDLLGPGRGDAAGVPNVPRNAPSTFNSGLWDSALFMDSRVASLGAEAGQNGAASGISTPDSGLGVLDANAGANLVMAQARFPVTSAEEMRGALLAGNSNDDLRQHLAARIGDYGAAAGELGAATWLAEFQSAFASAESAEDLITFNNIVAAIAEYERSQVFVDSPWRAYVQGDNAALSEEAKEGAILFYTAADDGGAACFECHSGDLFSDERHHAIGAPQFGPGKGNGVSGSNDFGRENISGDANDRFRFRTPTLLNIEVTGPYMHSGAYESLDDVMDHYNNERGTVNDFFDDGGWCELEQFQFVDDCEQLYPSAEADSDAALDKVDAERASDDPDALPNVNINNNERDQLVAFLESLTDPCVTNRDCLAQWIPAPQDAADEHQLNAVDLNGNAL